jgi:aerobic-type carbon monoxide dehydrogenase small subunit (CoxS/CutS family)
MTRKPEAFSRRDFIKGVIVGGVAVSSAGYLLRGTAAFGQGAVGERLITLNVNGQQRRVDVLRQETLAWTLRYRLGLTGTKVGCDRAECGSCTVLIDGVPHPNPTRLELAQGISGNLCRCQDYDKILTSMMRGAELMRRG